MPLIPPAQIPAPPVPALLPSLVFLTPAQELLGLLLSSSSALVLPPRDAGISSWPLLCSTNPSLLISPWSSLFPQFPDFYSRFPTLLTHSSSSPCASSVTSLAQPWSPLPSPPAPRLQSIVMEAPGMAGLRIRDTHHFSGFLTTPSESPSPCSLFQQLGQSHQLTHLQPASALLERAF